MLLGSKMIQESKAERMMSEMRSAGLKVTPQRTAIVRELAADPSHPTAQELYDRLRPELPAMSFATVYNTLASLESAGLCRSRVFTHGPARFDPNTASHDHAVCDDCGEVLDVPYPHDAPAEMPLAGFTVRVVERIFRGVCRRCAK